jgi:hypothetical protein
MNFRILYEFLESLNRKFILKMEKWCTAHRPKLARGLAIAARPMAGYGSHGLDHGAWLGVCVVVTALRPRVAVRPVAALADQGWQHELEQTKGGTLGKVKEAVPHRDDGAAWRW